MVSFDLDRIADAIFKAARAVGGEDQSLAEGLAKTVNMFLKREFIGRYPSVEDIQDVVEKVLIETGHAKTAKAYIIYREKRNAIRKVHQREVLSESRDGSTQTDATDLSLFVRTSAEDIVGWDRNRIIAAMIKEAGLDKKCRPQDCQRGRRTNLSMPKPRLSPPHLSARWSTPS